MLKLPEKNGLQYSSILCTDEFQFKQVQVRETEIQTLLSRGTNSWTANAFIRHRFVNRLTSENRLCVPTSCRYKNLLFNFTDAWTMIGFTTFCIIYTVMKKTHCAVYHKTKH